jgi:hypothetical protein
MLVSMVVCACHPSYGGKRKIGASQFKLNWAKSKTLSQKQPQKKGLCSWLK